MRIDHSKTSRGFWLFAQVVAEKLAELDFDSDFFYQLFYDLNATTIQQWGDAGDLPDDVKKQYFMEQKNLQFPFLPAEPVCLDLDMPHSNWFLKEESLTVPPPSPASTTGFDVYQDLDDEPSTSSQSKLH